MGMKLDLTSKLRIPSWYEDAYYKPTQDLLFDFGKDLLSGNPNDYYKPLGEVGGSEFQGMLDLTNRDIKSNVSEMAARTGTRSGAVASATANAIADNTTKLRWSDFLRAMEGRQNFLNVGNNMVSGVRGAGLEYQGQRNQFNLSTSDMYNKAMMQEEMTNLQLKQQEKQQNSAFWGNLIKGGLTLGAGLMTGGGSSIFSGLFGGGSGMGSAAPSGILKSGSFGDFGSFGEALNFGSNGLGG